MKIAANALNAPKPQVLKVGSQGQQVKALETRLKQKGFLKGPADAFFDEKTREAVIAYKRQQGWGEVGVVGGRMRRALKIDDVKPGPARPADATPSKLKGASYNCKMHRNPATVARWLGDFAKKNKLDFIQLQELTGYHKAIGKLPGYKLISFRGSKDHGETGVLVRDELLTRHPRSLQSKIGWTNVRGGVAQPRAATAVQIAGWLNVASLHAPPAIDWRNGQAVGPAQRIKAYGSLMNRLLTYANNHKRGGMLFGGDWNEGTSSYGKWSPSWLAAKTGMKKLSTGGIDWEMARGAKVTNVKRGPTGGSDHRIVTFTVSRPRK